MPTFFSPSGNPEVWDIKPTGYLTAKEWISTQPAQPSPSLSAVQSTKRAEINAGFEGALTASLTMPSRNTPPSAVELAIAIADFKVDDPTGLTDLQAIHSARRTALLAAVDAATTVEAVQSITVTYAV